MEGKDIFQRFPTHDEEEAIECLTQCLERRIDAEIIVASWRESVVSEDETLAASIKYWLDQNHSPASLEDITMVVRDYHLPIPVSGREELFEKSFDRFVKEMGVPSSRQRCLEGCRQKLKKVWERVDRRKEKLVRQAMPVEEIGMDTFISAVEDEEAEEVWLPAFSGETFRTRLRGPLESQLLRGHKIRILIYGADLMESFEPQMGEEKIKEEIRKMRDFVEEIREELPEFAHNLQLRLLPARAMKLGYFSGLLTFRRVEGTEKLQPKIYRVNVHEKPGMRGTQGVMIWGEGNTTLFHILQYYFEQAWKEAIPIEEYGLPAKF